MSDTTTKSMSRMNKPELYEYAKDLKKELLKIILFNIVLEEDNTKLKIRLGIVPSHKYHSDSDRDSDSESDSDSEDDMVLQNFTLILKTPIADPRPVKEIIEKVVQDEEEDDENVAVPFEYEGIKYDINPEDGMVLEKETSHQMGFWEPDKKIVEWLSEEEKKLHIDKKIFEESLRRPKQLDFDTTDYK